MKVKELVENLQKFDDDLEIEVRIHQTNSVGNFIRYNSDLLDIKYNNYEDPSDPDDDLDYLEPCLLISLSPYPPINTK